MSFMWTDNMRFCSKWSPLGLESGEGQRSQRELVYKLCCRFGRRADCSLHREKTLPALKKTACVMRR